MAWAAIILKVFIMLFITRCLLMISLFVDNFIVGLSAVFDWVIS